MAGKKKVSESTEDKLKKLNLELQRRLEERTAQLEAANKELESFSHSVSHDLRAPLIHIEGFSRMLLEDYRDRLDEEGKDMLERVRNASKKMRQIIDDLMRLSRLTSGGICPERVDLSSLVQAAADDLQRTHPERKAEITVMPGLIAFGDPRLLRTAIVSLLDNAWKFTEKKSPARIEFGMTHQTGGMVYFVRDNGTGFENKHADRLFAPFQRLHAEDDFPGSGIGLAAVQRIIRRHGGRVWAEGEKEKGAAFFFTL